MKTATLTRIVAAIASATVTLSILLGAVALGDPAPDAQRMAQAKAATTPL
jgi:hypothetical protein